MITEFIDYGAATVLVGPLSYILWRINQFRSAMRRGKTPHIFEPHIRRDMHGKHAMKWCDVCHQGPKAFIHTNRKSSDAAEGNYLDYKELGKLEQADIRYRFANDPEWVQVFGHEYDPITFLLIPQSHNGECGGPHDSCERCNYEDEIAKRKDKEEMAEVRAKLAQQDKANADQAFAEAETYVGILLTLWNTESDPDFAEEDFEDLNNELGMLKNQIIRINVEKHDAWQRIRYCLVQENGKSRWPKRERMWAEYQRRQKENRRYY
jgi:hypothetical protein